MLPSTIETISRLPLDHPVAKVATQIINQMKEYGILMEPGEVTATDAPSLADIYEKRSRHLDSIGWKHEGFPYLIENLRKTSGEVQMEQHAIKGKIISVITQGHQLIGCFYVIQGPRKH
jgi:hypothetical protein